MLPTGSAAIVQVGSKRKSWRLKVMSALARTATLFDAGALPRAFQFRGCQACRWNPSADLPDGQITDFPVQPLLQKYFCSPLTQITSISPAVSSPTGAYRDRHGRGAGCGGRGRRF